MFVRNAKTTNLLMNKKNREEKASILKTTHLILNLRIIKNKKIYLIKMELILIPLSKKTDNRMKRLNKKKKKMKSLKKMSKLNTLKNKKPKKNKILKIF